ncbi:MAG: RNA-binding ATPase activator esf2 [Thelocarpon impressellum]|nr:MAG: RNA-binding ATPase activator esf2 [Thelocarpon impressellum]
MTTRKRNDWLEAEVSDEDDDAGYDTGESEVQERKGGRLAGLHSRRSKRRKVQYDEAEVEAGGYSTSDEEAASASEEDGDEQVEEDTKDIPNVAYGSGEDPSTSNSRKPVKPLTAKELAATREASRKTGVIYLSRIPPFMKPTKLRSLLTPFGAIDRIFLSPEDPSSHTARVRSGGNKKRSYVDGWVEFRHKQHARIAAETLNAQIIGGRKGGFYHDDVWNMRYLRGFKWHHLTEQIANENAARAARLRAELGRSRKEDREFVRGVERSKMLRGMEEKRAHKKAPLPPPVPDTAPPPPLAGKEKKPPFPRHFRQTKVVDPRTKRSLVGDAGGREQSDAVRRVLSKIF